MQKTPVRDRGIRFIVIMSIVLLLQAAVLFIEYQAAWEINNPPPGSDGFMIPVALFFIFVCNLVVGLPGIIVWFFFRKKPAFSKLHVFLLPVMLTSSIFFSTGILPLLLGLALSKR